MFKFPFKKKLNSNDKDISTRILYGPPKIDRYNNSKSSMPIEAQKSSECAMKFVYAGPPDLYTAIESEKRLNSPKGENVKSNKNTVKNRQIHLDDDYPNNYKNIIDDIDIELFDEENIKYIEKE